MQEKVKTIAEFDSSFEAQLAKSTLESNGIKAVIVGDNIKGLLPADGMLSVQLQVLADDADRAKAILAQQEGPQPRPEEES